MSSTRRMYAGSNPVEILKEVFQEGKSEGWEGSLEDERDFMRKLNPFNVIRINAETGTWVLKRNNYNNNRKPFRRNRDSDDRYSLDREDRNFGNVRSDSRRRDGRLERFDDR